MVKVNPLRDFEIGDQLLKTGEQIEINDGNARGLADIGFVEIVKPDDAPRSKSRSNAQPAE